MPNTLFLPESPPNNSSHSEVEVFQALQDSLGPGRTVFSSVHWTHRNSKGKYRDGEADFVLYHPSFGLLVLEVKGGGIEFDPERGHWFTIPAGEERQKLNRSPYTQARSNLYSIIKILRRNTGEYNLPFSWGYGVVFPNVIDLTGLENQHPQAPEGITACANDLALMGEWCEQLARGGAGTGKTLLALYKALSFARQGASTLRTCFNRVLAESTLAIAKRALKASGDEWVLERDYLRVFTLPDYVVSLVLGKEGNSEDQDAEFWRTLPETFAGWR